MKNEDIRRGFSLIELLVVIAVILAISAIAIPNLLRSKISANEASAVASLRTLNSSCNIYSSTYSIGFPLALNYMGSATPASLTAAGLVDSQLAGGIKSGYTFTYVSGAPNAGQVRTYTISASPTVPNMTGQRYFFTDQTGLIRQNSGAVATSSSTPIN